MRYIIWIVFVLSFLVLNVFLLVPLEGRGVSWEEASLGIIPGASVAFICFALLLAGVGARDGSRRRRTRAWHLWTAALLWCLLIGGIVTYSTTESYAENTSRARSERTSSGSGRSYSGSLYDSYARYDRMGMMYGWATLAFAGVSLVGLIVSLALAKKAQDNLA